jgi:hypothetical protein
VAAAVYDNPRLRRKRTADCPRNDRHKHAKNMNQGAELT